MDAGQLHRLGRRLLAISRAATGSPRDPPTTAGEEAVLGDVLVHSGSTVRGIAERTGFVQSHVSASVAKLFERGLVTTLTDPADRRRTLVDASPAVRSAITTRAARDIEPALRESVGDKSADRAMDLLEKLAELVLGERR
jgi:DNA-binding MarR family transcriptional regulator